MLRLAAPVINFAIALIIVDPAGAAAATQDDLFTIDTLHELRLSISSRDFQQLRARFDENTFYAVDVQWRDVRIRNAAVRSRGAFTRNATKLGLEIQFDRYTTGQRFLGLRSLVLDNLWQDPAMVREQVAMAFFARMGQPAPREAFCRLYINNVYQGVYAIIEALDSEFLVRSFGEGGGYLFEYKLVRPYYGEYLGDKLDAYKAMFEPRTRRLEPDSILYSPIRDLFREVNEPVDAVWRERVDSYLDVEQFVTYVAIDSFLAELDGIIGAHSMNNFYLYRPAGTNRHSIIGWDKDSAFYSIDAPIFLRADENEVFRRLLQFEDLRALYLRRLEQCAFAASFGNWLVRQIRQSALLIAEAAYEDPLKPFANDEFDNHMAYLVDFARQRPAFVLREVAAARRSRSR